MRVFWNVLKNDLARTVCSKAFVAAVLGLTAATFLTGIDELSYMLPEDDLIYIYGIFQYLDFQLLFLLFAAIPGAALFCADWENRFIRFSAQRCSKRMYGVSKGIACFVSAVLVVVVSEWLDLMILRLWGFPAVNMENGISMALGAFDEIGYSERVYLYFAAVIFIKACCAGAFAEFALWLSTKITNVFVTLVAPMLAYYVLNTLMMWLRMPSKFYPGMLSKGLSVFGGAGTTTLVTCGIFAAFGVVFLVLFTRSCRRRLENG